MMVRTRILKISRMKSMPSTLTMELMEARSLIVEWPKVPKSALKSNKASEQVEPNNHQDTSTLSALQHELEGTKGDMPLPIQAANGSASEIVESQLLNPPNILMTPQGDEAGKPVRTNNRVESPVTKQIASVNPCPQFQESEVSSRPPVAQPSAVVESDVTAHEPDTAGQGAGAPKTPAEVPKVQAEASKSKAEAPERGWLSLKRFTTKTSWQEPQLCLGAQCCRIGGNECWEATGPALDLFTKVRGSIAKLLDTLITEIEDGQPVADNPLAFRMFMIGKSRSTARPTILFISQSQTSRKRAIKFVKDSAILKGHPKIFLADSAVFPMVAGRGPVVLFAANIGLIVGSVIGSLVSFLALVAFLFYLWLRRRKFSSNRTSEEPSAQSNMLYTPHFTEGTASLNDVPTAPTSQYASNFSPQMTQDIYAPTNPIGWWPVSGEISHVPSPGFRYPETSPGPNSAQLSIDPYASEVQGKSIICPSTGRKSRVGGLVYNSKGSYYGFTAAHVFQKIPASNSNKSGHAPADIQDTESEFEFDEDDEVDDEDLNVSDVAATSSASMSSIASVSRTTTAKSSGSTNGGDNVPPEATPTPLQRVQLSPRLTESEPTTKVVHPIQSSFRGTDLGLDWALIDPIELGLSDTLYRRGFISIDVRRVSRPIQPMPRTETQIVLSVGNYSSVKGKLWPEVTMMRLSQGSKFVQLWSISVDTPIVEGDSGTWVLDAKDGTIYGHIVAGVPGSGNAFIIPAEQVCADMESVLGPVEFVHFIRDVHELM